MYTKVYHAVMQRTLPLPVLSVLSLQLTTSSATAIRTTNTSRMARIVDSALTAGVHAAPERWDNRGTVSNRAAPNEVEVLQ